MASFASAPAPSAAARGHWFKLPALPAVRKDVAETGAATPTQKLLVHDQMATGTVHNQHEPDDLQKRKIDGALYNQHEPDDLQKRKIDGALWWARSDKDTDGAVRGGTAYIDFVDNLRISDNTGNTGPTSPWAPSQRDVISRCAEGCLPGCGHYQASVSIFSVGEKASRRRIILH